MAKDKRNIQFRIQAVDRFTKTMSKLDRQLSQIDRQVKQLDNFANIQVNVTGDKSAAKQLDRVKRKADDIPSFKVTHVLVRGFKDYQNRMDRLATSLRTFDEVASSVGKGALITGLPALVPIVGVLAGGLGAIGSAFTSAGIAAGGFAGVAIPAIAGVIQAQQALKEAQEAVESATNEEERAEAVEQLNAVQAKYNESQWEGVKALNKFTNFYKEFAKVYEPAIIDTFVRGLDGLKQVIELAKPAIDGAVTAVSNLVDAFNANLKTDDVRAFFDWLGSSGGKNLETLTKGLGNFAQGLFNMLVAFDPLAQSFNEGFMSMSERFREWSANLGNNQAFQNFMQYVRDNTPTVLQLIGNMVTTLVNLGIAMEPLATDVLEMANSFFAWTSELFKNHQWLGKLVGVGIMAIGLFKLFAPIVTALGTAFRFLTPIISKVWGWIGKLGTAFLRTFPRIALFGARIASLATPIGWLINIVIILASIIISNWDTIWSWTKETFTKVADWIVRKWIEVRNAFDILKELVSMVIEKFKKIFNAVKESMESVKNAVTTAWDSVMDFLEGINLYDIGKNIIQGLVNGVGSMAGALVDKASGVVGGAIDKAKNLLGINSPSKLFFKFGEWTGQGYINGLNQMTSKVQRASTFMTSAVIPKTAGVQSYTSKPRTSGGGNTQQVIMQENAETIQSLERIERAIREGHVIVMDKKEVGRMVEPEVSFRQSRNRRLKGIW